MRPAVLALVFIAPVLVAAVSRERSLPRAAPRTVWDSVYSASQAARGETAYVTACARCHAASLGGGDEAPPLAGIGFLGNWNGQTVADLHDRIRSTMPSDDPGTFARPLIADVVAYMLKVNGFPAGSSDLPTTTDSLKEIVVRASKP
jgi:mono/diheme cytochrome c family protein